MFRIKSLTFLTNEIYFDIYEEIDCIIGSDQKLISSEIIGSIQCSCKLSGIPDLILTFASSNLLQSCTLHQCVRIRRFQVIIKLKFFEFWKFAHKPKEILSHISSHPHQTTSLLGPPASKIPSLQIQYLKSFHCTANKDLFWRAKQNFEVGVRPVRPWY